MLKVLLSTMIFYTFMNATDISKIDSECYEGINNSCKTIEILEKSLNISSTDLINDIKYFKEVNFKDSRDPGYIILTNNTKWFFGYVGLTGNGKWSKNRPLYLIFSKKYGSVIIDKKTGVYTNVKPWIMEDDNNDNHLLQTIYNECTEKSDRLYDWNVCSNDYNNNKINEINRLYDELKTISNDNNIKTLIKESKQSWDNFLEINSRLASDIISKKNASVYYESFLWNQSITSFLDANVMFLDSLYFKVRE